MANYYIANPTTAAITSGSLTIPAHKVLLDTTDAVAADIQGCIDAGCVVGSATKTTVLDSNAQLVEKGAVFLLELVRAVASAGTDTFGIKGV